MREMIREHSIISINESEYGQKTYLDKGKGPADLLANKFNPSNSNAETSTHSNQWSESESDKEVPISPLTPTPDYSTRLLSRRLRGRRNGSRGRNDSFVSIYKFPPQLNFGSLFVQEPEIVSIGPYHRGKNHLLEFEDLKLTFLDRFLLSSEKRLGYFIKKLKYEEEDARRCYQQESNMSSDDFVEMMLLDGCFIVVLLHLLAGKSNTNDYDFIFKMPWMIPIIVQDLLKMENQLPFFILEYLFPFYKVTDDKDKYNNLPFFALDVLSLSFPMPLDTERNVNQTRPFHLLHLVYQSLQPAYRNFREPDNRQYHPSNHSIQSVTRLRLSGIKFRSNRETKSFLDIKYRKLRPVLEIPSITINELTKCFLINCVALEQSHRYKFGTYCYFTDYVAFLNLLISEPRDVAFLCADGIISNFSQGDKAVVDWLNNFQPHIAFNNRNSYYSDELMNLEVYFSSYWATVLRTYFSSPWSFISVFTAFLLIVCSLIQSIMSIVSYKAQSK